MHARPKQIIVYLGLPEALWKRLSRVTRKLFLFFLFFSIGYIAHADVPRLCLLRKTNKITRIGTKF